MTNLLRNPSFENGTRPVQPPFISGAWPPDWEVDWWYKPEDPIIGTGSPWTLPEMIVIQHIVQFPEIEHLFGPGKFALKCFWNAAVGFGCKQTNTLPAGRYIFTCPVKPDHWHVIPLSQWENMNHDQPHQARDDKENKIQVRPSPETSDDYYLASEVYASCQSAGQPSQNTTGWLDARQVPIGQYTPLTIDHIHPGGELTVRFGARGRWPFRNNGWFFDGLSLEPVSVPNSEPPPGPPDPRPLPEPGNVWAAIQAIRKVREQLNVAHTALGMADVELADAQQMLEKISKGLE